MNGTYRYTSLTPLSIREWMTTPVQVVSPAVPVPDAYNIMMAHAIRRLPVVDEGRLVGIVTLGDVREARPSPAAGLSVYEMSFLLNKLTVGQVMTHAPFTVTPDTSVLEAARIMLDHKVGGLPVVNSHADLVGIITESDVFRMLIDQWHYFTTEHVDPGLVASLIAEQLAR